MRRLNFMTAFLVMFFMISVSCSSPKSDGQKATEIVQAESPKEAMAAEASAAAPEASAPVTENVAKGEKMFKDKGCVVCHQLNTKLVGPALKDVAKAYAGDKTKLNNFLKGSSPSIIDPAQHAIMEPQIAITKAMSDADRMAIVEYLLSIK